MKKIRSLLVYHKATAIDLANHMGLSANSVRHRINRRYEWKFPSEVLDVIEFFKQRGGNYTIEEIFEEYFE